MKLTDWIPFAKSPSVKSAIVLIAIALTRDTLYLDEELRVYGLLPPTVSHQLPFDQGSTLTSQDYTPSLVVYVPELIRAI